MLLEYFLICDSGYKEEHLSLDGTKSAFDQDKMANSKNRNKCARCGKNTHCALVAGRFLCDKKSDSTTQSCLEKALARAEATLAADAVRR